MTNQVTIPLPQLQINRYEALIISDAVEHHFMSCPDLHRDYPSVLAKVKALELILRAQEEAQ